MGELPRLPPPDLSVRHELPQRLERPRRVHVSTHTCWASIPAARAPDPAVAPAANMCAAAIGTETDGSIVCPAGNNLVVGLKPTIGLISQSGIIPIAHSQDSAGPMARTVRTSRCC